MSSSGTPPTSVATTGKLAHIASMMLFGEPSSCGALTCTSAAESKEEDMLRQAELLAQAAQSYKIAVDIPSYYEKCPLLRKVLPHETQSIEQVSMAFINIKIGH
jgi:hypothetical protein